MQTDSECCSLYFCPEAKWSHRSLSYYLGSSLWCMTQLPQQTAGLLIDRSHFYDAGTYSITPLAPALLDFLRQTWQSPRMWWYETICAALWRWLFSIAWRELVLWYQGRVTYTYWWYPEVSVKYVDLWSVLGGRNSPFKIYVPLFKISPSLIIL